MSSKKTNNLNSSPSTDLYNDDTDVINLLNNVWSNSNTYTKLNDINRRQTPMFDFNNIGSTNSANNITNPNDTGNPNFLSRTTPLKSYQQPNTHSRQPSIPFQRQTSIPRQSSIPSIPTLPIYNLNRQQQPPSQELHLKYLESPNFDSFITFTPNNIQPNVPSSAKNHQPYIQPQPQQSQQPLQQSKSQLTQAQYLQPETLILLSPNLSTPLANKSNLLDLFDTPYLNSLYSNFTNSALLNDELKTTHSLQQESQQPQQQQPQQPHQKYQQQSIPSSLLPQSMIDNIETPTTEKLEKIFNKTPNSNDIFGSKNYFNTSTIKRLTNKSNELDDLNLNLKNSPCVNYKRKQQLGVNIIDRNKSKNTLLIIKESLNNNKCQDILINSNITSTPSKVNIICSTNTPKNSKKNKSKNTKKNKKLKDKSCNAKSLSNLNSNANVDKSFDDSNNDIVYDSSPSTIVVSSASKSISRLNVLPGSKMLETSPTPVNKYINNVLTKNNNMNLQSTMLQSNSMVETIPKVPVTVPVMGVFKESSNKSLKKHNSQPLNLGNEKPKKVTRCSSVNEPIIFNNSNLKSTNFKNNKRRNRSNDGMLHFIMADPDQLKGNKKRRVLKKKDSNLSSLKIPLKNSTNIVNNKTRTPSPLKTNKFIQMQNLTQNQFSKGQLKDNQNINENIFWDKP